MKRLLIAVLLALVIVAEAHAESFTISDIRVNGLQRVSAGTVFGAMPLNVGDRVDETELAEATRSLFRTGYFEDIHLGRDGNVLVVDVVERPSISKIKIEGNKAISTEDLKKGLKQNGLAEGEIFQQATLDAMRNELERQYVGQGRYSASIETNVKPEPRNRVAIDIKVNEGTVAAITHINIVGNTVFPTDDLLRQFQLKTTNLLSFIKNDDKYSREKLSGDLERLRSYYMDRGYINMDISSTQVSITPDKKHVYITINIDEGEKYYVRDVNLSGDLKVPEKDIRDLMMVQPGQVFSQQLLTTSSDLITRRLGNEGYTFANVTAVPLKHDEDNTVSVTFNVTPGKRAYVNRINFRGNTKTEDVVLRREMRQMEGGWASTFLIDQSKTRLERLGYFKSVNVETPAVPGTDDQVDVNFTVEEQPSGSISASVGFAQDAGLILGGSISQNNFLGTGNSVAIGVNRSDYQTSYNFSFTNPYFTPDGVSLGYNMFYRKTDYDDLDVDVADYSVDSFGGGINFGYPLSETSRLNFGLTIQKDEINTGDYTVDEIFDFLRQEGDDFVNYKGSIGWANSALNRGLLPTRGHSQSIVLTTTLPGSDLDFYKLEYRGQVFAPLTNTYTLRLHTDLGYADSFGSTDTLPFYENYYAGGFNSVRGFEDNSLGPRATPSSGRNPGTLRDPDQEPYPFGGNVMITGGAEILFPTPFVKDPRSMRTSLFWDVGNVFDTDCSGAQKARNDDSCDIDLGNLAASVGVGFTWITGMGPLSFSLGFPVKKPHDADTQVFQFSLGQTF